MPPKSMEPDRASFSINSLSLSIRLISTISFICFQRSFSRLDQTIKLNGSRCSKHSASLKKIRKIRVIRVRPSLSVILSTCIQTLNSTLSTLHFIGGHQPPITVQTYHPSFPGSRCLIPTNAGCATALQECSAQPSDRWVSVR